MYVDKLKSNEHEKKTKEPKCNEWTEKMNTATRKVSSFHLKLV